MDDYPEWERLTMADRLRLAGLEAELAGVSATFLRTIHEAADALEEPLEDPWKNPRYPRPETSPGILALRLLLHGERWPLKPVENPGEDPAEVPGKSL